MDVFEYLLPKRTAEELIDRTLKILPEHTELPRASLYVTLAGLPLSNIATESTVQYVSSLVVAVVALILSGSHIASHVEMEQRSQDLADEAILDPDGFRELLHRKVQALSPEDRKRIMENAQYLPIIPDLEKEEA